MAVRLQDGLRSKSHDRDPCSQTNPISRKFGIATGEQGTGPLAANSREGGIIGTQPRTSDSERGRLLGFPGTVPSSEKGTHGSEEAHGRLAITPNSEVCTPPLYEFGVFGVQGRG